MAVVQTMDMQRSLSSCCREGIKVDFAPTRLLFEPQQSTSDVVKYLGKSKN